MTGAFSAIISLLGMAGKVDANSDITSLARDLNNTKSITERARKSIFVYPVLFSSSMSDLEIDFAVSKFLELQYGIFTLMTVGLNPAISNGTIGEYLNSISAESLDGIESYHFKPYDQNQIETWYNLFGEENKDFFEEYKYVAGAEDSKTVNLNEMLEAQKKLTKDVEQLKNNDKSKGLPIDGDTFDETADISVTPESGFEKKLGDAAPTMIQLNLKLKGYESTFKVPIALKASPHFLRRDELGALFDSAIEDKRLLTRIVKLTSGEISFFKDFLFNIDRIRRDQKLYEAFGQHPWYQQFIGRKEKNRAKRLSLILSSLFGKGKEIVSATSNYLPTASIILTVDDLEKSMKMKYGFLLKNEKILWNVLNHLGLLCIGIYDVSKDTFSFYFNGFKKPLIMLRKQMKSRDGKSDNEKMTELMLLMTKRGLA